MTIANISISHVFIVADIVDEFNIGVDFMIALGINLNMGQQIMSWWNLEIPILTSDISIKRTPEG